jgi:hypothetical protein
MIASHEKAVWRQSDDDRELQRQRCKKFPTPRVAKCVLKTKMFSSTFKTIKPGVVFVNLEVVGLAPGATLNIDSQIANHLNVEFEIANHLNRNCLPFKYHHRFLLMYPYLSYPTWLSPM